jgi:hypothetical protein
MAPAASLPKGRRSAAAGRCPDTALAARQGAGYLSYVGNDPRRRVAMDAPIRLEIFTDYV